MMAIYDTYREAVIANGGTKGIYTDGATFYANGSESKFIGVELCNPADYLETLESFLASGKRLVCGDLIVSINGLVISIKQHSKHAFNTPKDSDNERFILQAAADKKDDTANADREFVGVDMGGIDVTCKATVSKTASGDLSVVCRIDTTEGREEFYRLAREHDNETNQAYEMCIDTTPQQVESLGKWIPKSGQTVYIAQINTLAGVKEERYFVVQFWCNSKHHREYLDCGILFPTKEEAEIKTKTMLGIPIETPAEREERERLEAAYDLYLTARSSTNDYTMTSHQFLNSMVKARFLAIVDKTGYRKQ